MNRKIEYSLIKINLQITIYSILIIATLNNYLLMDGKI